jgi:hypothetical protein
MFKTFEHKDSFFVSFKLTHKGYALPFLGSVEIGFWKAVCSIVRIMIEKEFELFLSFVFINFPRFTLDPRAL